MQVIQSKLNPRSADFQANAARMRGLAGELQAKVEKVVHGGGEAARQKHTALAELLPRERIEHLLDCSVCISAALGRYPSSRVARALIAKRTSS